MNASDMHYKKLADRVRYFKENEEIAEGVGIDIEVVNVLEKEQKKLSQVKKFVECNARIST